jgi:hypothetical protein
MNEQQDGLHRDIMNLPCKPSAITHPDNLKWYRFGHREARHAAAELAAAASSGRSELLEALKGAERIYVECCQCDNCNHIGINDADGEKAACNSCDWTGATPQEDRCPGCGETGTMARACPQCGDHYRCVAEGHIDARGEPAARAIIQKHSRLTNT